MDKRLTRAALILVLLATPGFATAVSESTPGLAWEQLSPEQQQLLGRFESDWDAIPAERREKLARGARRWSRMTTDQRALARQRLERWRSLSGAEQERLRERFERFQRLPPEQRARIRERHRWFKSLPPERRKALREKWRSLSPGERRQRIERLRERRREMRQRLAPHQYPLQGNGLSTRARSLPAERPPGSRQDKMR